MKLNKTVPIRFNDEIYQKAVDNCKEQNVTLLNEIREVVKKWSEGKYYIERKECYSGN